MVISLSNLKLLNHLNQSQHHRHSPLVRALKLISEQLHARVLDRRSQVGINLVGIDFLILLCRQISLQVLVNVVHYAARSDLPDCLLIEAMGLELPLQN